MEVGRDAAARAVAEVPDDLAAAADEHIADDDDHSAAAHAARSVLDDMASTGDVDPAGDDQDAAVAKAFVAADVALHGAGAGDGHVAQADHDAAGSPGVVLLH